MLFDKSLAQYILAKRAENLSEKTLYTYERDIRQFFYHLNREELNSVSNEDIENYLIAITPTHSPKTRQNKANSLRGFFKYWYAKREVEVAYELIQGPRKIPERQPNVITAEQYAYIDGYLNESDYYQLTKKLIFSLLWNTGMRIGELLSINLADINLQEQHLTIRSLKSKRLRVVVWNDDCHELLLKYLGVRVCLNQAPELFQTPQGIKNGSRTRLTSRTVQRWCQQLSRELGFPINPHAFRHGRGHYILHKGGTKEHIQLALGHVSLASTESYTRLNATEQLRLQQPFLPEASPRKTFLPAFTKVKAKSLH